MTGYNTWGVSWGNSWGVSWGTGSTPTPTPVSDNFLPEHHAYRKSPPGNIRFVYDGIRKSEAEVEPLLEAIEPFIEEATLDAAKESGRLPELFKIDYAALSANEEAYQKFTAMLDRIREQLKQIADKQHAEDDELLLMTVFCCTIN